MIWPEPNRDTTLAGVGGVALVISLFLPWYGATVTINGVARSTTVTAWHALATSHVMIFLCGLAAAYIAVFEGSHAASAGYARTGDWVLAGVGMLATALVVYRLVAIPVVRAVPPGVHLSREEGAVMALLAALAITFGGVRNSLRGQRRRRLLERRARPVQRAYPEPDDLVR
jgi:hypothetical protein